jgi:hypothetical protein
MKQNNSAVTDEGNLPRDVRDIESNPYCDPCETGADEREAIKLSGHGNGIAITADKRYAQLTCERCGQKTDGGAWIGFAYVGAECLTKEDQEYIEA